MFEFEHYSCLWKSLVIDFIAFPYGRWTQHAIFFDHCQHRLSKLIEVQPAVRLKIVLKENYLWYLPQTYRERPWDWENSWWPSWPRIRNEKELHSCQRQVHQTPHPILQQRCPLSVSYAGWIQHGWFCDRYRCQFSEKSYLGWIPGILRF